MSQHSARPFNLNEPLYCKHTGAYLSNVADFCSLGRVSTAPERLVSAPPPKNLDNKSWIDKSNVRIPWQLHERTIVRKNVRSILFRNVPQVDLLLNPKIGTFLEATNIHPEDNFRCESVLLGDSSFQNLICLLRHQLIKVPEEVEKSLSRTEMTSLFILESGVTIIEDKSSVFFVRNNLNGRRISINYELYSTLKKGGIIEVDPSNSSTTSLMIRLCNYGILRNIFEG